MCVCVSKSNSLSGWISILHEEHFAAVCPVECDIHKILKEHRAVDGKHCTTKSCRVGTEVAVHIVQAICHCVDGLFHEFQLRVLLIFATFVQLFSAAANSAIGNAEKRAKKREMTNIWEKNNQLRKRNRRRRRLQRKKERKMIQNMNGNIRRLRRRRQTYEPGAFPSIRLTVSDAWICAFEGTIEASFPEFSKPRISSICEWIKAEIILVELCIIVCM